MRQRLDRSTRSGRTGRRLVALAAATAGALLTTAVWASTPATAVPVVTQTTVTLSATTSHPYQSVTATAAITPATAAGTVTFTRAGTTLCSARPVGGGSATCTFTPTATSAAAAVTAAFTPTVTTASAASSGTGPALTVAKYPVTIKAVYDDTGTATCAQRAVTVTVTRTAVAGSTPTSALPAPGGTVAVDGAAGITLPASGSVTACAAVTTSAPLAVYSGDSRYLTGQATGTRKLGTSGSGANHTRSGTGGSTPVEGSGPSAGSGLAATASAHVEALMLTAFALLAAGLGCLLAGRRRRA